MAQSESRADRVEQLRDVYLSVAESPTTTEPQQPESAGAKSVSTRYKPVDDGDSDGDGGATRNASQPLLERYYDGLADAIGDGGGAES